MAFLGVIVSGSLMVSLEAHAAAADMTVAYQYAELNNCTIPA